MGDFKTLTVFTGDIVGSTDLDPATLNSVFDSMSDTTTWLSQSLQCSTWFDRHRGDGWQFAIERTEFAIFALSLFWTDLVGASVASRVSVAVGSGTIVGNDLSAGHGDVFLASGHGLDGLASSARIFVDPSCPLPWHAALPVMSFVAHGWTARQAQVCGAALRRMEKDLNVSAFARDLDLQRQTVQSHLKSAGYWEMSQSLFSNSFPQSHR